MTSSGCEQGGEGPRLSSKHVGCEPVDVVRAVERGVRHRHEENAVRGPAQNRAVQGADQDGEHEQHQELRRYVSDPGNVPTDHPDGDVEQGEGHGRESCCDEEGVAPFQSCLQEPCPRHLLGDVDHQQRHHGGQGFAGEGSRSRRNELVTEGDRQCDGQQGQCRDGHGPPAPPDSPPGGSSQQRGDAGASVAEGGDGQGRGGEHDDQHQARRLFHAEPEPVDERASGEDGPVDEDHRCAAQIDGEEGEAGEGREGMPCDPVPVDWKWSGLNAHRAGLSRWWVSWAQASISTTASGRGSAATATAVRAG